MSEWAIGDWRLATGAQTDCGWRPMVVVGWPVIAVTGRPVLCGGSRALNSNRGFSLRIKDGPVQGLEAQGIVSA